MTKRLIFVLLTLTFILGLAIPSVAAAQLSGTRLVDDAQLLTNYQINEIRQQLDIISEKHQVDIIIVTQDSIGNKTPRQFADDYFDYNGYGYGSNRDGVLLLISMEDSDWYISTSGFGITAFTDAGIDYIGEQFTYDLSSGNYGGAFLTFADLCDEFITAARNGEPYDSDNLPKEPYDVVFSLVIAVIIGFVVALIATAIMKGQLNSIRSQIGAGNYVKTGSMNVTESRDMFLYRRVDRRLRPQNNGSGSSTHRSSSGRSHGGGGGKF